MAHAADCPGPPGPGHYAFDPFGVVEIPANGLAKTRFECFSRLPTQVPLNLAGIHRVPSAMAGTIADKFDLLSVRAAICAGLLNIENITQGVYDIDVGFFGSPSDVVSLPDASTV